MSDDERYIAIGKMVYELRELRKTEPCLVHKLQSMMEALEIAASLTGAMVQNQDTHHTWQISDGGKLYVGPSNDMVEYPTPSDLAVVLEELKKNRERAAVLKERLNAC